MKEVIDLSLLVLLCVLGVTGFIFYVRVLMKLERDAGRRGRWLAMPLKDTLAPWKDQPWAKDLERPEFREETEPYGPDAPRKGEQRSPKS